MASTTLARSPANDRPLRLLLSRAEQDTAIEILQARLDALDLERRRVEQALAAVKFSTGG